METQEQKMVEQLSMRRMEIEMLRCEVLFRYYERLLGLDVINDRDEVKSIMTCITHSNAMPANMKRNSRSCSRIKKRL